MRILLISGLLLLTSCSKHVTTSAVYKMQVHVVKGTTCKGIPCMYFERFTRKDLSRLIGEAK